MNNSADKELLELGYKPKLSRSLNLFQLVGFGLNYLQPIGPAVIFGYLMTESGGTVSLPYLLACIGMLFTAFSYSLLVQKYPLSGSVYNYVSKVFGNHIGFISGWLLILDYILIPTITSVSASIYAHNLFPSITYEMWLVLIVCGMGAINLLGVKISANFGLVVLVIGFCIVIGGFVVWSHAIANSGISFFSWRPFHFQSYNGLIQASSLAVFSFLGFDAITTLAEEAANPKRDIPRAIFISLFIGCFTMVITGYLGMLLLPNWMKLASDKSWVDATLFMLAQSTGGGLFTLIYTLGFILAMAVTNIVGMASGARLLFAMGRESVLPNRFFTRVNKKFHTPHYSILFIMALELCLGSVANQGEVAQLINYGALAGFIMLNLSVIRLALKENLVQLKVKSFFRWFIFPAIGASMMFWLFINMKQITFVAGTIWLILGIGYYILNQFLVKRAALSRRIDVTRVANPH